jgi:hypothetical protein
VDHEWNQFLEGFGERRFVRSMQLDAPAVPGKPEAQAPAPVLVQARLPSPPPPPPPRVSLGLPSPRPLPAPQSPSRVPEDELDMDSPPAEGELEITLESAPPPAARQSPFDKFIGLEERLDAFEERLALAPLPPEDPFAASRRRERELEPRVQAIRSRLKLLGYPVQFELSSHLDESVRRAVRSFQRDAGITVDGWVGEETWHALQEFITLEPTLELDRWYPASGPCIALVRAVSVRLRTLGFSSRVTALFDELLAPLAAFKAVVHTLGLTPYAPEALSDREAVRLLFNDEALLELEPALETPLRLDEPEDESPTSRFVRRLIRGELWMMGYDVGRLDKPTDEPDVLQKLKAALHTFWMGQPEPPDEKTLEQRTRELDKALVQALRREHEHTEAAPESIAAFIRLHGERMKEIWSRSIPHNPVFFLWDGIKRGARWLGRRLKEGVSIGGLLKRGVEYAKTFFWNVVRFVYQRASDAFTLIRKAISALLEGVEPYLAGELRTGSGASVVACRLRFDLDSSVVLGPDVRPEQVRYLTLRLERMGRCISAGSSMLSSVAGLVGRTFVGPAGWLALLPALIRQLPRWSDQVQALANLPPLPDEPRVEDPLAPVPVKPRPVPVHTFEKRVRPQRADTRGKRAWLIAGALALVAAGLGVLSWWG